MISQKKAIEKAFDGAIYSHFDEVNDPSFSEDHLFEMNLQDLKIRCRKKIMFSESITRTESIIWNESFNWNESKLREIKWKA